MVQPPKRECQRVSGLAAALERFGADDLATIAEFVRLNRELLLRHTERLREMRASGGLGSEPFAAETGTAS